MSKKKCEFMILIGIEKEHKIKWETGSKHYLQFSPIEFKEHAQLKKWCEENCSDKVIYWETDAPWNQSDMVYFFNEEDAAACKLRWL